MRNMISFIWYLIIGGILGWLAGVILGKDVPGGIIGNIIAGIVGSWIGSMVLGNWGWRVSDFYVFPALIGAIVLIFIVSLILKGMRKAT
jgi:uncharacterized membrane protein YeaQ/YmgE (transglycosylase-associated protein family)